MSIPKKLPYILMISVIVLLIGSLIFSVITINKKNDYISKIETDIAQNKTTISEQEQKNAELQTQIESKNKENEQLNSDKEKLSSELEAAKSEKDKLKKENSKLKTEIENLKAKRKAEAQAAINAATPTPAPTPAPTPTPTGKVCYLTFDDGPSKNTLRILDTLAKYNAKATFFVVHDHAEINYVKNIQAAGHAIGLHSYTHDYSKIYKSSEAYFADLNKLSDLVYSLTGIKSNLIRFPGGGSNTVSKKYCKGLMTRLANETAQKGYYYFDWNVSSEDASGTTVSYTRILNSVLNGAKGKNNICVLMHDSSAKTTTADALPYIIEGLSKQGFSFHSLTPQSPGFKHGINN